MDTARKDCIWYEHCGAGCHGRCDAYSPVDSTEEDEAFYRKILEENIQEYQKMIDDYSDGRESV